MAERREDRSSEEIRREIDGTRAEMHETVEALERKLSPGQLVDDLWDRFGGGAALSSVGSTVREHPVPLALMGLGVAWLAIEKTTQSEGDRLRRRYGSVGAGTHDRAEGRVGPYRGEEVTETGPSGLEKVKEKTAAAAEKVRETASGAARSAQAKAAGAADHASSGTSGAAERASGAGHALRERAGEGLDRAGEGFDRVGEGLDRAREGARRRGRQARRGFWSAMEEQPLALGAAAFGLGLAGGLAAPGTRLEDRTVGDAADAVKGEARRATRDAAERGKRVARDAALAAKEEAERREVAGELKESARRVAEEAKETAERRAQEEGLHARGMKERASEAKERVRDPDAGSEGARGREPRPDEGQARDPDTRTT